VWSAKGIENHGGGYLYEFLHKWKPEGRDATLADAFAFEAMGGRVLTLHDLYQSAKHQIAVLAPASEVSIPAPTTPRERRLQARAARQRQQQQQQQQPATRPSGPTLPTLRLNQTATSGGTADKDAFHVLELLLAHESNLDATWQNHVGQTLSVTSLFQHTWRYYVGTLFTTRSYVDDHSHLHMVAMLLRYADRNPAYVPNQLKERFLRGELREQWTQKDGLYYSVVGHHMESLGRLLADSRVTWTDTDKRQVRAWIGLHAPAFERPLFTYELTHAFVGLGLILEHADKLN
jgi:hypothetical protein